MSKKKTNPRDIPCSMADLKKAVAIATDKALHQACIIMLYVLADKLGYRDEALSRAWMFFNRAIEEIEDGRIKPGEIEQVLKDEYDMEIKLE